MAVKQWPLSSHCHFLSLSFFDATSSFSHFWYLMHSSLCFLRLVMSIPAETDEYSTATGHFCSEHEISLYLKLLALHWLICGTPIFSETYGHAIKNINSNLIKEAHGPRIYFVLIVCFNQRTSLSAGSLNQSRKCMTHLASLYSICIHMKKEIKFIVLTILLCVVFFFFPKLNCANCYMVCWM